MTKHPSAETQFADFGFSAVRDLIDSPDPGYRCYSEIILGFQDQGRHELARGGTRQLIPERRLALLWGIVPYQSVAKSRRFASYYLTLPLPWFMAWQLPPTLTVPLLAGHIVLDPCAATASDEAAFQRWVPDVKSGDPERQKIVLLELEARLRRLALSMQGVPPAKWLAETVGNDGPAGSRAIAGEVLGSGSRHLQHGATNEIDKATRMALHIAQHLTEPLCLQDIANAAGLNAAYAASLFGRTYGITPVQYLMRHRVWHAQRLLATTNLKIVQVGRAAGFTSESRFYETFKRLSHQSPREYRDGANSVSPQARPSQALHR